MSAETVLLGIAGIIIGIAVFAKTGEWIPALIPAAIGIGLLFFRKEDSKVEQRKDINTKKSKKKI